MILIRIIEYQENNNKMIIHSLVKINKNEVKDINKS